MFAELLLTFGLTSVISVDDWALISLSSLGARAATNHGAQNNDHPEMDKKLNPVEIDTDSIIPQQLNTTLVQRDYSTPFKIQRTKHKNSDEHSQREMLSFFERPGRVYDQDNLPLGGEIHDIESDSVSEEFETAPSVDTQTNHEITDPHDGSRQNIGDTLTDGIHESPADLSIHIPTRSHDRGSFVRVHQEPPNTPNRIHSLEEADPLSPHSLQSGLRANNEIEVVVCPFLSGNFNMKRVVCGGLSDNLKQFVPQTNIDCSARMTTDLLVDYLMLNQRVIHSGRSINFQSTILLDESLSDLSTPTRINLRSTSCAQPEGLPNLSPGTNYVSFVFLNNLIETTLSGKDLYEDMTLDPRPDSKARRELDISFNTVVYFYPTRFLSTDEARKDAIDSILKIRQSATYLNTMVETLRTRSLYINGMETEAEAESGVVRSIVTVTV